MPHTGGLAAKELAAPSSVSNTERANSPEAGEEMDPGAQRVHGRVIDVRTGEGLADQAIRLYFNRNQTRWSRSDSSGEFGFELAPGEHANSLWIKPQKGWRWTSVRSDTRARLAPAQREGAEAFVFNLAENRTGFVSGVAVDAESGEPIPDLRFELKPPRSSGGPESIPVHTSAKGRFVLEDPVAGGLVWISSAGGGLHPKEFSHDLLSQQPGTQADLWRVEFHGAPTYRFTTKPAVDLTGWSFFVLRAGEEKPLTESEIQGGSESWWSRPARPRVKLGESLALAIGSPDGKNFGRISTAWTGSEPETPLVFELESTGTLGVALEFERPVSGAPAWNWPSRQRMELEPQRVGLDPTFAWRLNSKRYLNPGAYLVRAWSREHQIQEARVEIAAGEHRELRLDLSLLSKVRTVHGSVACDSGSALPDFFLYLNEPGHASRGWTAGYMENPGRHGTGADSNVQVSEEDPSKGTFRIERVPLGTLELTSIRRISLLHSDQHLPIEAQWNERPDGDVDLEVRLLSSFESGLGFEFESGETPLPRRITAKLATREPGGAIKIVGDITEGVFASGSPDDRSFEWALARPGMRTVYGDANDFHHRGGGRYLARVRFQAGWATRVLVHGPGDDPLGQAQVFLDGVPSGTTDSNGLLELAAEAPPTSWSVTYADWLPKSGQFPAIPGALGRENVGWQLIEMRAPDKPVQK